MLTVCCVKWGDKYPAEYVHKLQNGVSRHLTIPHRFVCFTDDPAGLECETKPLPDGLDGWWNKVWLFKRGLFDDRVIYLDLDISPDPLTDIDRMGCEKICDNQSTDTPVGDDSVFLLSR